MSGSFQASLRREVGSIPSTFSFSVDHPPGNKESELPNSYSSLSIPNGKWKILKKTSGDLLQGFRFQFVLIMAFNIEK